MIVAYIHAHKDRFGVEPICRVLTEHEITIAPGTYYKWAKTPVSADVLDEAYAVNTMVDLHIEHRRVYGVRKLWHAARRAGVLVGRDRVQGRVIVAV